MFARLDVVWETEEVDYLSVALGDDSETLFERFLDEYDTPEHETDLDIIQSWMAQIGERGAEPHHFRPERRVGALPPKRDGRSMFRLYALRLSPHVVILFGGGLKTAQNAQDCPTVGPHFALANKLAKAIDEQLVAYRGDILDQHDEYVRPEGGYSFDY